MSGIFISYRRDDSAGHAGWLYSELAKRYGDDKVFMDLRLPPGDDFVEHIERGVGSCEVLLAIIGNEWVDAQTSNGERRLDDPQDFVRLEVETALEGRVRVLPVLVGSGKMPASHDLPRSLQPLARRQALELTDIRWDYDVRRLVEAIDSITSLRSSSGRQQGSRTGTTSHDRSKPFVTWGWILATFGSLIIPFLALFAMVMGVVVIKSSDGKRTGTGVGIIVVSIFAGLISYGFWSELIA